MTKGVCKLCGANGELKESHIVPRFVYQWMRRTGGSYFRSLADPASRKQDGQKEFLLCSICEQRFSSRETYFKQSIFDPYIKGKATTISYDQRLFYFNISLAWRNLILDLSHKGINAHPFIEQLRQAEVEWRNYLLTESIPAIYNETHLFFADIISSDTQLGRRMNLYFTRVTDGTIVSNADACAVYWKFARFISFSAIIPFDQSLWIGTRVHSSGGVLKIPQEVNDGIFGGFLTDRARLVAEAIIPFTEKQKEFHDQRMHLPEFIKSDLNKVIKSDALDDKGSK